jgi:GntR family transcriptional regulator/MocR family aminotransferase
MTTLHLPLDRASATPLHRQIYDGVRRAILDGRLRPGQRIPSTRGLAEALGVSRLPVLGAYDQLLHEGYLEGRVGSGTFVSRGLPDDLLAAAGPSPDGGNRGPNRARVDHEAWDLGPFRMNLPALDQFPHAIWARLVARHAHRLPHAAMAYGDPAGLAALRTAIARHLRSARAVRCEPEQVLVVAGSQAALRLAAAVLLSPGDRVAMEEPGYAGARAALKGSRAEVVPVPVDDEGMRVDALPGRSRRVRAVYVTPSHQYPLGVSMSAPRRFALLDWAQRSGAWVLEDDYDSEYRYVSRPLGALQGMDPHGRVIYTGTFSKVLFPALRVGYLVVPPALMPRFLEGRDAFDLFSPTLYQAVLAELLSTGAFARHLRRMRAVYLERRSALLAGLARDCRGQVEVLNADAGLHLTVLLRGSLDDAELVRRMAGRGLIGTPLSSCYVGPRRRSGLLLGFGGSTPRKLGEATRVLGDLLRSSAGMTSLQRPAGEPQRRAGAGTGSDARNRRPRR